MRHLIKLLTLFLIGGTIYYLIEISWRGYSHLSMFIVGGISLIFIGFINIWFDWEMPLYKQGIIATCIILVLEFVTGCIVNLWLGLKVWDYSHMPLNLFGQIQLYYSALWYLLSIIGILLDDFIRWQIFKEEKPRYRLF